MEQKYCYTCERWLDLDDFPNDRTKKDGKDSRCRSCNRERMKNRAPENEAKYRQKQYARRKQQRQEESPEEREARLADQREYYAEHRDELREQHSEYQRRTWPERYAQIMAWHHANAERVREIKRAWSHRNIPAQVAKWHRRRAKQLGNGGSHTAEEWEGMCAWFGGICLCCGQATKLTRDHVVPIEHGGTNYIWNLQPLCGPCNSRKGATTIDYRDPDELRSFLEAYGYGSMAEEDYGAC